VRAGGGGCRISKNGKIGKMTAKLLASSCLLLAALAAAQNQPATKRPSLDAEITALSHDQGSTINVEVKITNNSEAHVFMLLFGEPSAFDDAGGHYGIIGEVAGVAYCPGPQTNPPSFRLCVGKPRVDSQYLFPLDGYTEIEPGQAATVHYTLRGGGSGGQKCRLAQEVAYRTVKEADLPKPPDLKSLHFGSLSFNNAAPGEVVTSRITFDMSSVR
jgi:hypothetical protein